MRSTLVALALILTAGSAGTALAQAANSVSPSVRTSCIGDYFRFCGGLNPAGAEVKACFRQHIRDVSPDCRAAIAVAYPEDARRYRSRRPPA